MYPPSIFDNIILNTQELTIMLVKMAQLLQLTINFRLIHVDTSLVQVGLKSTRDSHVALSSQYSLSPGTGLPEAAEGTLNLQP